MQARARTDFIRMCATNLPRSDLTGESLIQIRGRDQEQQDAHEFCNHLIDYLAELKVGKSPSLSTAIPQLCGVCGEEVKFPVVAKWFLIPRRL